MEVAMTTGASLRQPMEWHSLNWRTIHRNVRRLQVRIVKAWQAGKKRKARALQFILTRSLSGKALAVRRVTENQGKRTAGVDGETWTTPAQKAAGIAALQQRGYRAQPLKRVYIPKSNGKKRPLGIPTMKDRAMQALYKLALDPIAETTADPNSYGFREERSTADAMEQIFHCLNQPRAAAYILEGDIQGCFDHISHDWLLHHIPLEKRILAQWLKAGYLEKGQWFVTAAGTPQGGIISPVLANLTRDGLEKKLKTHRPVPTSPRWQAKIHLVRYADDFIITGSQEQVLQEWVKPLVQHHLQTRGLTLSAEKTHLTHIEEGFDFLGHNIRQYRGKLLIKPARQNVQTFLTKVRQLIKTNPTINPASLIYQLNPLIRGWTNYHRHGVSKKVFKRVDYEMGKALWNWAKRRHPGKAKRWIKHKYFRVSAQGRDWCFYGRKDRREANLFRAMTIPITRHVKIRGVANPYDPDWERYFEQRQDQQMTITLQGKGKLLRLWQQQQGRCPVCQEKITAQTGWHSHHLIYKVQGGADTLDNRVLLHPNCHRQVHCQGLNVAKPRPSPGVGKA